MKPLKSWLAYIETLHPQAIEMGLDRIAEVARRLHLLPVKIPVITVTGTNGKGSCVALMEAVLLAQGYRVGAYTSPHLLRYNERVRINGETVSDAALCAAFTQIEANRGTTSLTFFEFGTLAALLLFQLEKLDVLILEVGLGGRLDAVNIVDADIAILSTIAVDHREWLGNDREQIGREKAGILRAGKVAVCGDAAVPVSVSTVAREQGCALFVQGKEFGFHPANIASQTWDWWSQHQQLQDLPIPKIELQNASTVLKAIELLPPELQVGRAAIERGLRSVYLPGRFQIIPGKVECILDVAHNPAAAQCLANHLETMPCVGSSHAVVAMLADKDRSGTIMPLLAGVTKWYVGSLAVPRGGAAELLVDCLLAKGAQSVTAFDTVIQAYRAAEQAASPGDRIIVFGSFYTVAEVLKTFYV